MEDLLIQVLETFNYPVYLQGSFPNSKQYPKNLFTFWNDSTEDTNAYDNDERFTEYAYSVNFYSVDAENVYNVLRSLKPKLKQAGFIITTGEHSIPSDVDTHDGRGMTVLYKKKG